MEDSKTFQSWFLVDISPFKMALLNGIKKWSYAFKKHLLDHVIDSLDDLDNFIKGADEGLSRQVVEGDYKGLIKVMEYLAMVKEKQKIRTYALPKRSPDLSPLDDGFWSELNARMRKEEKK